MTTSPPVPGCPEYISQQDAAARWSVSLDTIRRMIRDGKVTGYRLNGRIIRVRVEEIDAAFKPIPTIGTIGGDSACKK